MIGCVFVLRSGTLMFSRVNNISGVTVYDSGKSTTYPGSLRLRRGILTDMAASLEDKNWSIDMRVLFSDSIDHIHTAAMFH